MARTLWRTPDLHTEEEEHRERKTSWLDLFFDLVFVAVIAELSHSLATHVSWEGVLGFIILFVPAWWVWLGATFYNDRFELDDVSQRVFTFLLMLPVAALAYNVHDGLGATATGYILSYVAARILIIFLWLRGGWYARPAWPMTTRYAVGFSISVILWLISIWVPAPARFVLWGLGLLIDLATPISTRAIQARLPRLSTSRLPERFGLFTLIVLGESVIGVVGGAAEQHDLTLLTGVVGVLGLGLAFSLWWIYFDTVLPRPRRPGFWSGFAWGYLHMPLTMGLAALGAGVLNILALDATAPLPEGVRWLVSGALAVVFMAMALMEWVSAGGVPREQAQHTLLHFGAAGAALLVGFVGGFLPAVVTLALLTALALAQAAFSLFDDHKEEKAEHREAEVAST